MNIPILNIYYMLVYAWDVLDEAESLQIQADDCTKLVDLFARVLHSGAESILRRGLDRGYVAHRETIAGIKGKLDISASIKVNAFQNAQAVCEFDEFSHDVLHNRILKSTIRNLLTVDELSAELRDKLAETNYRLHQIAEIAMNDRVFRSVQLHRNNRQYRLLMDVCRLIYRAQCVNENPGENEFSNFVRDKRRMRILFEKFVRNFYRNEQNAYRVGRSTLVWAHTSGAARALDMLPKMHTDITLRSKERVIVIETKFVPHAMLEHYGKKMLRSGHLYQLFAYLRNLAPRLPRSRPLEGILLYPTTSISLDAEYQLHGHRVRVATVDLSQPAQHINSPLKKAPLR